MKWVHVKFTTLALVLLGLSLATVGWRQTGASAAASPPEESQIGIKDFAFQPATLAIPVGAKVTWINHDDEPHRVMSVDKRFASPVLDTDDRYSNTFTEPGTYEYFCSIHPKMTARVIVESEKKSSP